MSEFKFDKPCEFCGKILKRRIKRRKKGSRLECPSDYKKRKYCSLSCSAHSRGNTYRSTPDGLKKNACWVCKEPVLCKGLCEKHYVRMRKHGDVSAVKYRGAKGTQNKKAKLTDRKVIAMRKLAREGFSERKIAAAFGVNRKTAHEAIIGTKWKHVPFEDGQAPSADPGRPNGPQPLECGVTPAMSCSEIAEVFGVSDKAIHWIEKQALDKLRRECEKRGLSFEDFFEEAFGHPNAFSTDIT